MPNLKLTLACWDYDRTRPLIDGRVQAARHRSRRASVMRPREIFPRMLENQEFHASELSLASYVGLLARGECPFVACRSAVKNLSPLRDLCAAGGRHPDARGFARQTRGHDPIRRQRRRVHARYDAA